MVPTNRLKKKKNNKTTARRKEGRMVKRYFWCDGKWQKTRMVNDRWAQQNGRRQPLYLRQKKGRKKRKKNWPLPDDIVGSSPSCALPTSSRPGRQPTPTVKMLYYCLASPAHRLFLFSFIQVIIITLYFISKLTISR